MGKGDIGFHFSDMDAANKNRDSREFLRVVRSLMTEERYQLVNADVTIIAQSPKMAPHIDSMKQKLALDLDADLSQLNIKATTTEKLGFAGRKEGIAVHAVVLLEK
jgi:2-C-methyl-D-erythritol 2,4-cyclodiphosphate synthase